MLTNQKITDFLEKTAAGTPVPGGGSVSALSAALGAGLAEMVANLTIAKKGYEAVAGEMNEIAETLKNLREKLMLEVDKDSNAYQEVLAAFKLPKKTEAEIEQRAAAIQDAMAEKALRNGNRNAVSDGAVGTMMARTAALGALFNVKINLASVTDKAFVEDMMRQVNQLESRVREREKEILSYVKI